LQAPQKSLDKNRYPFLIVTLGTNGKDSFFMRSFSSKNYSYSAVPFTLSRAASQGVYFNSFANHI